MSLKQGQRQSLTTHKRWVIKIGSALLTANGKGIDHQAITGWVEQIALLHGKGIEVVLVSSGAVAEGVVRLGWEERPNEVCKLQAAAAVGQMGLVQTYESAFQEHDLHTAQVLLTHDDLSDRRRYLNSRSTLQTLLSLGVVPIVNENDTVATDEIRFGDNDSLGGLVANLVEADALIILTDQEGLFDADPRQNPEATLITEANVGDESLDAMASDSGGALGRGGMATKLGAARLAARSGASTVIAGGHEESVLLRLQKGESLGSLLIPDTKPLDARKQWLSALSVKGQVVLDAGATNVLLEGKKSLLSVGITAVSGDFTRGELIACVDSEGKELARGLSNYRAADAAALVGVSSDQIKATLGYQGDDELIHRDNLFLLG